MLHVRTLLDGLQVVVEPLPHTHSVSLGCFVGVGSGHEAGDISGIAHFIEHMLFKGSRQRPHPKLIADAIEGVGGILDAYTSFESTVYYAKVAHMHFDRAVDVLADMLRFPCFDLKDVEKERRVIAEELRQTADTPSELIHQLLDSGMWGDQPFGRDIAGDEHSIMSIMHEQIITHWQSFYTQANMVISVAGNVDPDHAWSRIETALAGMPVGVPMTCLPSRPPLPGPRIHLRDDDSEQGNFCLGFPGVGQFDPDRRAMLVLDTILGGSTSSRLFQRIREDLGLAYSIGSYSREHHDAGKWVVYGSVEPDRLNECVATVLEELQQARNDGITEEELASVKQQVEGGILLSLEDTWSVAARNGSHQLRYGRVIPVEQVVAEVDAVSCADVARVTSRMLREDAMHLAVIGPDVAPEALAELLTFAPAAS
ncbi:MAG TPA: pitrilysin family protein [Roseiflexaceae bacterium]|nr:pitrilysin family protein [Roseiflexaceae bacterium]